MLFYSRIYYLMYCYFIMINKVTYTYIVPPGKSRSRKVSEQIFPSAAAGDSSAAAGVSAHHQGWILYQSCRQKIRKINKKSAGKGTKYFLFLLQLTKKFWVHLNAPCVNEINRNSLRIWDSYEKYKKYIYTDTSFWNSYEKYFSTDIFFCQVTYYTLFTFFECKKAKQRQVAQLINFLRNILLHFRFLPVNPNNLLHSVLTLQCVVYSIPNTYVLFRSFFNFYSYYCI